MRRLRFASTLTALAIGCQVHEPTRPAAPSDVGAAGDGQLALHLEFVRRGYDLPALAALSVRSDGIIETAAVGRRAIGFDEQVTIADRWRLGSLTKSMTATLAAVLVERGDLSWETTVGAMFPDLIASMRSEYRDVTLGELLYHTSGLPDTLGFAPWDYREDQPMRERRRRLAADLLALAPAAPRGTHLYTNAGYIVAGSMLEEASGELWEDLLVREVFAPLGMISSGFGPPGTPGTRDQPWGHTRHQDRWWALDPGVYYADLPAAHGPSGGVHASMDDYAAYLQAHLAGARGTASFLTVESFGTLHTPPPGSAYALGWNVLERDWAGGRVLQHEGVGLGYAVVWLAPERDVAVFVATNVMGYERDVDAPIGADVAIQVLIRRFETAFGGP